MDGMLKRRSTLCQRSISPPVIVEFPLTAVVFVAPLIPRCASKRVRLEHRQSRTPNCVSAREFHNGGIGARGRGHLLPNDHLVLGYIFDFFSRQATLTTTSFDKKIVPVYNFSRVSVGWHIPGFDALHFLPFRSPCPFGGHKRTPGFQWYVSTYDKISSAGKNRTLVYWKSASGRR